MMTPKNSVETLKKSEILSCAKVFSAQEWGFPKELAVILSSLNFFKRTVI